MVTLLSRAGAIVYFISQMECEVKMNGVFIKMYRNSTFNWTVSSFSTEFYSEVMGERLKSRSSFYCTEDQLIRILGKVAKRNV
nr:MAG TPA: hypothetical protein [Caudoviricetes sp.]